MGSLVALCPFVLFCVSSPPYSDAVSEQNLLFADVCTPSFDVCSSDTCPLADAGVGCIGDGKQNLGLMLYNQPDLLRDCGLPRFAEDSLSRCGSLANKTAYFCFACLRVQIRKYNVCQWVSSHVLSCLTSEVSPG